MKIKIICIYITLILFFILTMPYDVFAEEIISYKVTDGFEMTVPNSTKTYFYINIPVNYISGKVVLALNDDGTGNATVGESIDISVNPGGTAFEYKTQNSSCNGKGEMTMKPLDISHLLHKGLNNVLVRYRTVWCSQQKVSQLYLVHFNDYEPSAEPFLNLPWDYQSKGMTFEDAATSINSYFDHEYPLLSANWFIQEPSENISTVTKYDGINGKFPYTAHDGYDYAKISNVILNDSVLAAAAGIATFHNNCTDCGNAIFIDHGNGYQTRYYHLQPDGLITNNTSQQITVSDRQPIGKVGLTGNTNGAHIHFMVVQDKNGDGNFNDNIPDGLVDPYGWQGSIPDPWPQFTFIQNGTERTGSKSSYLWKNSLNGIKKTLTSSGGTYTSNRFTFTFPSGATTSDLIFGLKPLTYTETSAELLPIGYVIDATADNGFGYLITQFNKLFNISIKLLTTDFSRYKPDSLSIYSSSEGTNWQKENTVIDMNSSTATTQVNHLTQFAFMGEKKDSIAPVTKILINDSSTPNTSYSNTVSISFDSTDEPTLDSLGIENTFYKVNDNEWQIYSEPIVLNELGTYSISFYSTDKDGNTEEINTVSFELQNEKDQPEIEVYFDTDTNKFTFNTISSLDTITNQQIQKKERKFIEYTAQNSDHITNLLTYFPEKDEKNIVKFSSLQYDKLDPIQLEKYRLIIYTIETNNGQNKFIQIFQQGDEERIKLAYNIDKDKTILTEKKNGEIVRQESLAGLHKLVIVSNNGNLNYLIQ